MMERHFYALLPSSRISNLVDRLRDRYYPRGIELHPPHITLVPPFQTGLANEIWFRAEETSRAFQPFNLRLMGWGVFSNRQEILHLRVSVNPEFQNLRNRLMEVCDIKSDWQEFNPHLTVGKFTTRELEKIQKELEQTETNLEFIGDRLVDFREKGDGSWEIAHELKLT
jgi:2'-5' RNA ligase